MNVSGRLSRLARRAMARETQDYISKDMDELAVVAELKRAYGLETVYRFDIGKNTDGFSPLIKDVLETPELVELMGGSLVEYPENHYKLLRKQLSFVHGLPEEWFALGAGLESVIDQISRALLDPGDIALMPTPNFDVFESSTVRVGADPEHIPMDDGGLRWTEATLGAMEHRLGRGGVKLAWISNPVNPTGQQIPLEHIERLAEATRKAETFLVVDEAYGEYTDRPDGVVSASRFLEGNPQLMVLRTFSKIYCLPSARVGYMAGASPEVRAAVTTFRPMFPFSWISLYMAQLAILDDEHIQATRDSLSRRKERLYERVRSTEALRPFTFLESDTNTIMFRHDVLSADALHESLARRGFLTANLNRLSGIEDRQFLRLTVHNDAANMLFLDACAVVAQEESAGV